MKTVEENALPYFSSEPVFGCLCDRIRLSLIVKAMEKEDLYTYLHSRRVRDYAVRIFHHLNMPAEKLSIMESAALFHDIGKIYVPYQILYKPSRLTVEEFGYIHRHPTDGARLISEAFPEDVSDISRIIEQHHERLDGSGYPKGLKGDRILPEAKVIAVADSYDALTTDRPYRKAISSYEAIRELKQLVGTQYDEAVVNALEKVLRAERNE